MPCEPMPLLVPISERNAGEACASSKATFTSSSIVSSRPPYCSGIDRPNRPSSRICATSAGGISSLSATCGSAGISASRTKRRTLSSSRERVSSSRIIKVLSAPGTPNDRIVREGCCESAARSGCRMDCAGRSGLGVDQRAERRIGGLDDQRISRFAGQVGAAGAVAGGGRQGLRAGRQAHAVAGRLAFLEVGLLRLEALGAGVGDVVGGHVNGAGAGGEGAGAGVESCDAHVISFRQLPKVYTNVRRRASICLN